MKRAYVYLFGHFIQIWLLPEVYRQVFNCFLNAFVIVHLFQFTTFVERLYQNCNDVLSFTTRFLRKQKSAAPGATLSIINII